MGMITLMMTIATIVGVNGGGGDDDDGDRNYNSGEGRGYTHNNQLLVAMEHIICLHRCTGSPGGDNCNGARCPPLEEGNHV
jgi:hypothetical protein